MIINHSLLYLIIKLLNAAINFYITIHLTSSLGASQFGQYSQIISLSVLIGSVLYLPITASITRYLQQSEDIDAFVKTIYISYVLSTLFLIIFMYILCDIINRLDYFFVIGPLIFIKGGYDVNLEISRAKLSPFRYGIQAISQMLIFLFILYVYAGDLVSKSVVYMLVASYAIASVLFYSHSKRKFNKLYFYEIFNYGKSLILVYFLGFFFQIIDKQLIAYYLPSEYLAYYQVVNTVSQSILLLLISSFSMTCYPLLVKHYKSKDFHKINKKMFYLTFGLAIPALFGFISICSDLIDLFFGRDYVNNTKNITWIVAVSVFNIAIAANYFDFSFKLTNNNIKQLKVYIVPIIIIIAGNYFLVEKYKITASAAIFLIATIIMLLTTVIEGRRYLKMFFDVKYIVIILMISSLMSLTITYINTPDKLFSIILKVLCGGVFFIISGGWYIWKKIK